MQRAIVLSDHAAEAAARRGIPASVILSVAAQPEQVVPDRPGSEVRQSRVPLPPDGDRYLVSVFVDITPDADVIVGAYRTSKLAKYWRTP